MMHCDSWAPCNQYYTTCIYRVLSFFDNAETAFLETFYVVLSLSLSNNKWSCWLIPGVCNAVFSPVCVLHGLIRCRYNMKVSVWNYNGDHKEAGGRCWGWVGVGYGGDGG